jgi:plasmid stabilization system protein ParE
MYFRQDDARLIVLRILHTRRDITTLIDGDDPTAH